MSAEDRGCLVCSACRQKAPQQLHVQLTASQRCRALCFLDHRQHQHPLDGHPCWVVFNQVVFNQRRAGRRAQLALGLETITRERVPGLSLCLKRD